MPASAVGPVSLLPVYLGLQLACLLAWNAAQAAFNVRSRLWPSWTLSWACPVQAVG
ncbi:hypothetical protein LZ31DRAFT_556008 [Colletotrichum somersetense]|nr:hypothetical protein LZ31DRAFT_556008 [Colletotrichum somersetense]